MKKLLVCLLISGFYFTGIQAQNVDTYLTDYGNFVAKVGDMDTVTQEDKAYLDSVFQQFTDKYHDTYKAQMTNSQLSKYIELRMRYKKKMALRNGDKFGDNVEEFNTKAVESAKRTGSKVSGFLKGVFKKEK